MLAGVWKLKGIRRKAGKRRCSLGLGEENVKRMLLDLKKNYKQENEIFKWKMVKYEWRDSLQENIHHHYLANMELGRLLTRSGLTLQEVSLVVSPGFFCLLFSSFLLSSVIYYKAFCLHVATNLFRSSVFCPKLGLY